jgi:hypothetical protein
MQKSSCINCWKAHEDASTCIVEMSPVGVVAARNHARETTLESLLDRWLERRRVESRGRSLNAAVKVKANTYHVCTGKTNMCGGSGSKGGHATAGSASSSSVVLVVKREKSKTHEAQTTSIGRYTASQERAGAAGSVHGRMMTQTLRRRRVERQRQRLAYARLGGCSGSRQRTRSKYCPREPSLSGSLSFRTRGSRNASIRRVKYLACGPSAFDVHSQL